MSKKTATKKKTIKKQLKKQPLKKSKKKIAEQKKLIRTIKTPERFFKPEFGRYGGEVVMGEITEAQFNHWEGKDEEFGQHMNEIDWAPDEQTITDIPEEARFTKPFYEYDDICHTSGPEFSDGQYMTLVETDKDGEYLKDDDGNFVEDQQIDMETFKKRGVKIKCEAEHNSGSKSCTDKYYFFGQYFNKGGWYAPELIKTGPEGFDFKKMSINYEDCDGFRVFSGFTYDGEHQYLEEDSTGKSSTFYVMEGDDV